MTTWIRLSDRIGEHPKTLQVPRAHRWAIVELLGYCSRNLTDGFIPAEMMARLVDPDELASLMDAGFTRKHPGGYMIHDYLDWQESREEVQKRSAKRSIAGKRGAAKRWQNDGKSHGKRDGKHHGKRDGKTMADTDTDTEVNTCSLLEHSINEQKPLLTASAASVFEKFWTTYPRKVGKARAEKAFSKEIKTTPPGDIIAGAERLANDPNLPDKSFIPHPATWLTRAGWLDEPHPAREKPKGAEPTPTPPRFDRAAVTNPEAVPPPSNLHDILRGNTA